MLIYKIPSHNLVEIIKIASIKVPVEMVRKNMVILTPYPCVLSNNNLGPISNKPNQLSTYNKKSLTISFNIIDPFCTCLFGFQIQSMIDSCGKYFSFVI
jgi:hypothetical protein